MRVCHIITNLEVGGAESMLLKLLMCVRTRNINSSVISLIGKGAIGPKIEELGIRVDSLGLQGNLRGFVRAIRLPSVVKKHNPDLVCTWMYHSDLLGGVASYVARPSVPIVWNLRTSLQNGPTINMGTWLTRQICSRFSRTLPSAILCNSAAVLEAHRRLGYDINKLRVIPNGFDLEIYKPSSKHREDVRHELRIPSESRLIGMIARFDPAKDHMMFLRAAQVIAGRYHDVHFVLCGEGVEPNNPVLGEALRNSPYKDRFHLLGRRSDMPRLHASLDIGVLASITWEGFPNAVGESMACGVPCVVTDTGGSPEVVGDCGRIVPAGDANALAENCSAILAVSSDELRELGTRARQRIRTEYSIDAVADRYIKLWKDLTRDTDLALTLQRRAA